MANKQARRQGADQARTARILPQMATQAARSGLMCSLHGSFSSGDLLAKDVNSLVDSLALQKAAGPMSRDTQAVQCDQATNFRSTHPSANNEVERIRAFMLGCEDHDRRFSPCANAPVPIPAAREDTAPENRMDAADRLSIRIGKSREALDIQIAYEDHRDRLKTRQMIRALFFCAGVTAFSIMLSAAAIYLLTRAGIPKQDAVRFGLVTLLTSAGGTGLGALARLTFRKFGQDEPCGESVAADGSGGRRQAGLALRAR